MEIPSKGVKKLSEEYLNESKNQERKEKIHNAGTRSSRTHKVLRIGSILICVGPCVVTYSEVMILC